MKYGHLLSKVRTPAQFSQLQSTLSFITPVPLISHNHKPSCISVNAMCDDDVTPPMLLIINTELRLGTFHYAYTLIMGDQFSV